MRPNRGKSRLLVVLLLIAALFAPPLAPGDEKEPATRPAKVRITISKETTRILGPVNADGTVNYLAALDARLRKGVTLDNNAAIPLVRALGPKVFPEGVRKEAFERLGIGQLPERGRYFVKAEEWKERQQGKQDEAGAPDSAADGLWEARAHPWSEKDFPLVSVWLKANEGPLALVLEASKRRGFYVPLLWKSDRFQPTAAAVSHRMPFLNGCRPIARALCARAMQRLGAGDFQGAKRELLATYRLARLLSRGPWGPDHLMAMAVDGIASKCVQGMAISGRLTAAQCTELFVDLRDMPALPSLANAIDPGERFFVLAYAMWFAGRGLWTGGIIEAVLPGSAGDDQGEKIPSDLLDWDAVLRQVNASFDQVAALYRIESFPRRKEAYASLRDELDKLAEREEWWREGDEALVEFLKKIPKPGNEQARRRYREVVRRILVGLLAKGARMWLLVEIRQGAEVKRKMAQVALALAAYKAELGKFPAKLEQLIPGYLETIPKDYFTDRPLIYKIRGKGYILYSAGPNMREDVRRAWWRKDVIWPRGDDIILEVK